MLNEDYKDILQCLLDESVEFLLIGAYAMAAHGYPRATKDIDLWLLANPDNAKRLMRALIRFGAPVQQLAEQDFHQAGAIFQIGVSPRRIDLTTIIDGPTFSEAWKRRKIVSIDGLDTPVISREDLIANKLASGRPQDLVDADRLKE